jgi:ABC-2 type transport system ATP-binding protein
MVETNGLGKTYGPSSRALLLLGLGTSRRVRALHDITLCVEPGEILGLVGPNGAGKTTLLRLLATLLPPSEGRARVAGADVVCGASTVRRLVGLASGEERGFYWRLSGWENLVFFAGLRGLAPRTARARALETLDLVNLLPMAHELVASYSTGMRQRLGIARALLGRPRVLLLDEPTRSLDPVASAGVQALVRNLARGERTTVLMATHSLDEAERICDRVAVLVQGTVRGLLRPEAAAGGLAGRYHALVSASSA